MKKSLIALAVLAASGAAVAQSSVTIYGRVDASFGTEKTNGLSQTKLFDGGDAGLTSSRWGLRGTEDLGGGLTAEFKLENRFKIDAGTIDGVQFKGDSFVGLGGSFGKVKLGRSTVAYDDVRSISLSSNVFDSAFTPVGKVYGSSGDYASRGDNQIRYESPNLSGFSAIVSYGFGENKGATDAADLTSLGVFYKSGPLSVGVGFSEEEAKANANAAVTSNKFTGLSASYNFGVASVSGGYNTRKASAGDKDNEYTIGVNVPVDAFSFSVGYANSETKDVGGAKTVKASGFGLGVTYAMSKRTKLYAGFRDYGIKNAVTGTKTTDSRLYAMGVRHDF